MSCTLPSPVVEEQRFAAPAELLRYGVRIRTEAPARAELIEPGRQLEGMLADALRARRVPLLPAHAPGPELLVRILRWRERSGSAAGSTRAASVSFQLELRASTLAEPALSLRIDETQHAFSANLLAALRYPGWGLRWLTVDELGRFAAQGAIDALLRSD